MGVIKGKVVTRSGNPVPGVTVSGILGGLMGGVVQTTTDREGRFVLNYPGVGQLARVAVSGGEAEENVPSGSNLTLFK